MENFIPTAQGPASFRAGSVYVGGATQTTGNAPLLVPFKASDEASYMLEFSAEVLRIFNDDGLITANPLAVTSVAAVTATKPGLIYVDIGVGSGHGILANQYVLITDVAPAELNGYQRVTSVTSTTIRILSSLYSITMTGFTGASTVQKQLMISTPYVEADFRSIQVAQARDTMYIVHPNYPPRKLTRTSDTVWTLATYTRTMDPFGVNNYPGAVAFHQSRIVMAGTKTNPAKYWYSVAASFDDFTTGTDATDSGSATLATETYATIRNIRSVDSVLVMGCSDKNRVIGGTLAPTFAPEIRELDTDGSSGITPGISDQAILLAARDLRRVKSVSYEYNASGHVAVDITKAAEHMTLGLIKQMAFQCTKTNTNWVLMENGDLAGLHQDLQEGIMGWFRLLTREGDTILSIASKPAYQGFDDLWLIVQRNINGERVNLIERISVNDDLLSFEDFYTGDEVYDRDQYAWYLFEASKQAVFLDSSLTYDGSAHAASLSLSAITGENVSAIVSTDRFVSTDVGRELWAKGQAGRFRITEYVSATHVRGTVVTNFSKQEFAAGDYYFTASSILSGLGHLEGETVSIVADGSFHKSIAVENGSVTLDFQASIIHVGLPYEGLIKAHDLAAMQAMGMLKGLHGAQVRFLNSLGAAVGSSRYKMEEIPFRKPSDIISRGPQWFTGFKEVSFSDSSDYEKSIYIRQSRPAPCHVTMIRPLLSVGVN